MVLVQVLLLLVYGLEKEEFSDRMEGVVLGVMLLAYGLEKREDVSLVQVEAVVLRMMVLVLVKTLLFMLTLDRHPRPAPSKIPSPAPSSLTSSRTELITKRIMSVHYVKQF